MWLTNATSCSAEYQLCSVRVEKKAPVKSVKLFNKIIEMSKQDRNMIRSDDKLLKIVYSCLYCADLSGTVRTLTTCRQCRLVKQGF